VASNHHRHHRRCHDNSRAPSSTKNREQKRDPEMHRTKKGKQWYFGMKAHVGVDNQTKAIH
jgi:IS5 family transposase